MKHRVLLLFVLWLLCVPRAGAQLRIEESVIVTATAEPVPFDTLARTVTVITRREIARLPARSVAELLQYVSSVEVRSRGARGIQSDFQIRGAAFGQTLVLVNGVRINDAQSGHHNADIPVALADVERIEILHGPGSSLYGADAFGGTINVITRREGTGLQASVRGGGFDTAGGSLRLAVKRGRAVHSFAVEGDRSSGFMYDRGYTTYGLTAQTAVADNTLLLASYLWKDFGANGFYGPAPSREWTNQAWFGVERRLWARGRWSTMVSGAYRTHGDHFLYDITRPALSENFHRTHAGTVVVKTHGAWSDRTRLTIGGETGGDWVRSTNLGDRSYARGSVYAEARQAFGARTAVYPGFRYDAYSRFGSAFSPSVAATAWLSGSVKLRASAGRAFRVPTFTELYYRDPNHLASADLRPERAWSVEGGLDYLHGAGWLASVTAFTRRERDVIDWVRPDARQRWQTTNIRRVTTSGVELGLRRLLGEDGSLEAHYTWLSSEAQALALLSKYVLDYAPRSLSLSGNVVLPAALQFGQRVGYRRRADGRRYWVADSRLARSFGRATLFVEATNLTDTSYQEVVGVQMPGRWIQAGLTLGTGK